MTRDETKVVDERAMDLVVAIREAMPDAEALAILCCEEHELDRRVAQRAAGLMFLPAVDLQIDGRPLREAVDLGLRVLLLACTEGTTHWRTSRVPMSVLGDGDGVRWWRSAELRARAARRAESPSAA